MPSQMILTRILTLTADGIGNNTDTDDDGDGQSDVDEIANGTDPLVANPSSRR